MPKYVFKNCCPFYSKNNLPFLTNAGREMEERFIIKNPNVSSPSKVLVLFLDAENVSICFGGIKRAKRINEFQTHP